MGFIKENHQQIFPDKHQYEERNRNNNFHLQHVFIGNPEDIPHNNSLHIDRGRVQGNDQQTGGKEGGKYKPDHRIFPQAGQMSDKGHGKGSEHPGEERTDRIGETESVSPRHTGNHRVGEGISHQ